MSEQRAEQGRALRFRDRAQAGRLLAERLSSHRADPTLLVLGLPRGGVPVAFEVARALGAPLDVLVVRKLGVPGHEELAMGALASGGVCVLNHEVVLGLGIGEETIARAAAAERVELERRERAYRGERGRIDVAGRTVVVVDDGLATGSTMLAAVRALAAQRPRRLIAAVPVAARETCDRLRPEVDELVCAATPEAFHAVGLWYDDFAPTSDAEVRELLERSGERRPERG